MTVWTVLLAVCLPLGTGPWSAVPAAVAQEVSPELLDEAARRTGLSREELLARYRQRQGTAATDTSASGEPGRTSLDGIDDARLIDSAEQAEERWRDTDAIVELPGTALLESGLLDGLAEDLAVVPGDTVGYFGHDFFQLDEGVFAPPSFGPIGGDHRLGVGDELVINVWGGIDFQLTRIVDRDGAILLPRAGKVVCAGRTLDEVNASVKRQLARSYASIDEDGAAGGDEGDTYVEVTLGQLRAIRVFVIGAVQRPGSYELSSASRVLTALYAAGGPTVSGSLRDIRLLRGQDQIASLDMYRYLLGQGLPGDRQLQEGDTVFVPDVGPSVRLAGEVRRPLYYEMKQGETLSDLFGFAGGFTADAAPEVVHISRTLPPSARSAGQPDQVLLDIPYDAGRMQAASGRPVLLLDGDLVTVEAITERQDNWVKVTGHVKRPGTYQFTAGATVLDLLEQAGGLWPDALTERAVLDRTSDTLELSSLTVPLAEIMAGRSPDLKLQPRDELYVFSLWDARERPQVFISGEVFRPHEEAYRQGMTLRDLVLKAGGLKESADLLRAEVSRSRPDALTSRDLQNRPNQTVDVIEVTLAEDFLTRVDSLPLKPWDRVVIRRLPWWEMQRTVDLRGEVFYPGSFSLERKDERLSALIARAGGLKPDAYLVGARVVRKQDNVGNIAIDLARALGEPGSQYDIILQDGDTIIIPDNMFTVKVVGEVGFPTSLIWERGEDIDYYVERAGGYLEQADEDKTRVVWPNGLSLPNEGGSEVVAGSTIVVPVEPPPEGKTTWETIRDISSIVASLATVYLVVTK